MPPERGDTYMHVNVQVRHVISTVTLQSMYEREKGDEEQASQIISTISSPNRTIHFRRSLQFQGQPLCQQRGH